MCSCIECIGDQPEPTEREVKAWAFVEKYANGGERCSDCRYSDQSGPGWGHTCKVLEGGTMARPLKATDCPALPDDLYPNVVTVND